MVNNCIRVLLFSCILYISCTITDDIISSADPIEIISPQENTSFEVGEKIIFQVRQTDVGDLQGVDVYLDEQKIDITQNSPLPDMLAGEHKLKLVRGGKVIDKVIFVVVEKDVPEGSDCSSSNNSSDKKKRCPTPEEFSACSNAEVYYEILERNLRGCTTDDDCVVRNSCKHPPRVYNRLNEEQLKTELAEWSRRASECLAQYKDCRPDAFNRDQGCVSPPPLGEEYNTWWRARCFEAESGRYCVVKVEPRPENYSGD